ncbi:KR domain-containing protein [Rhizobium binae]|uniref:KR domain-containing protein n=1 Tax=Rhizobium binae TaxID=1138190 RepID=UPI001C835B07|nr:KR domain-containing protein [Rhizobium binae]MBX4967756.1 KR domain-containing protein [Rhizobium binae]
MPDRLYLITGGFSALGLMGVKAKGLHHVLHSLGHETLDWIVNFSSLASYGNHAQASYAAANTYLDALAQSMDSRGRAQPRILSINWGPIHAGELDRNAGLVRYFEESGVIPMPAGDIFPTLEDCKNALQPGRCLRDHVGAH